MDKSVPNKILEYLNPRKGKIVFVTDFLEYGDSDAVRQTLVRLAKEGVLIRLAKGIYLFPKRDPELGILYPSIEDVAESIAKRDRAKIKPAGVYALHKLGLSTQVPLKVSYLTDGTPRKIKVGKQILNFKPSTPKKLALKGNISSLAAMALEELGQKGVTENALSQIKNVLKREDPKILLEDAKLTSAWIRKIFFSVINR